MTTGSKGSKSGFGRFLKSFGHAFEGIKAVWSSEQNFRIHTGAAAAAISLGIIFSISPFEWMVIILLISGMMALETMNTAVEKAVDLFTREFHPLAKMAKDAAAGAVLLYAIGALIIGCFIFIPKIL
jgi:diacylglycerol kinase